MAKGLRSSVKKSNKTKLRSRVFGPVEAARTERLAAKLLELAQQPKPERPQKPDMEIDSTEESTITTGQEANKEDAYPKDMDIDGAEATSSKRKKKTRKSTSARPRRHKPRNQITFPTSRGKGALKPFSESRIRKRR